MKVLSCAKTGKKLQKWDRGPTKTSLIQNGIGDLPGKGTKMGKLQKWERGLGMGKVTSNFNKVDKCD